MDAYEQLKTQARQKRDAAVKRARVEYRDSLHRIDQLRATLGEDVPKGKASRRKPTIELICDLMPRDRAFTFADIHRALTEAEPGREFNQLSVRTLLPRLQEQGIIRRVTKNQSGRVLWAAVGAPVADCPFGGKALTEVAEIVLKECGPLTPVELVVAIQDRGYRADANPRQLVASLRNAVRRYPGRFQTGQDGRWGVLG